MKQVSVCVQQRISRFLDVLLSTPWGHNTISSAGHFLINQQKQKRDGELAAMQINETLLSLPWCRQGCSHAVSRFANVAKKRLSIIS